MISSGYYLILSGAPYRSDFATNIFGWTLPQPYRHSEDTSQSQISERSDMSYYPERILYEVNIQDYSATWLEGWTDVLSEHVNIRISTSDTDI